MRISRREMIGGMTSAAAAGALPRAATAGTSARRPNILFIMADDLGYADVSCYGRQEYQTPHIDRLAREGVRLTQAYANSPVCSATRTALITGQYQYRLRVGLEEPLLPNSRYGLPPAVPTLPSILRKAGYRTSLVGKWHLGELPDYGPSQSGYDDFWGIRGGGVDYFTHDLMGKKDLWDNAQPIDRTGYLTDLIGQKAIDVIVDPSKRDQPFFLSLHFTAPHWPWEGPGDHAESERLGTSRDLASIAHFDGGSMDIYAAMVVRMDYQIGRILDVLDRQGLAEDTIVVFTSDNGGERFSNVWPFTGRKGELLEGGLRIPAIVRWPRHIAKGRISEQVNMSMDWMPTLLAAAGVDPAPALKLDGRNILPALTGSSNSVERQLYWRFLNLDQRACRIGNWKYLKILENEYLFDVAADPLERANLKGRHPDVFARLTASFREWEGTMLPLEASAATRGFSGAELPDHFGVKSPVMHSLKVTE